MTDRALTNAESKKKQLVDRRLALHSEISEIDAQIGEIDSFIQAWHLFAEDSNESALENSVSSPENKSGTAESLARKVTGNSRKEDVAKTAREIILERGFPMETEELYDALISRDMIINGKDPKGVLTTMLWRMRDVIMRISDGRYWPRDVPSEMMEYAPRVDTIADLKNHEHDEDADVPDLI